MPSVRRSFLPVLLALPFLGICGAPVARAADGGPAYPSLDGSVTTVRGTGDEIEVVTAVDRPGGRQYLGLMVNGERVIYGGSVTQITGDWHPIHFFRDETSAYLLLHRAVFKLPGGPLSAAPFRVFEVERERLPEELRKTRQAWRGISVERADGATEEFWVALDGQLYRPGAVAEPSARLGRAEELAYPYVTVADFRSRYETNPAVADPDRLLYHIYGMTPDPRYELIFDYLELRPGDAGYAAYTTSRAKGKIAAVQLYRLVGGDPHYHLSNVYAAFEGQVDRPAFDAKLMRTIREEDRTLGPDRTIYVWAQDDHSRLPGGIRLFQGYAADGFITKDFRLPIERSHPHLDLRGRFPPGTRFYEMNRLAIRKDLAEVNTRKLLSVLVQYLEARRVPSGQVIWHTDAQNVGLFQHLFGARVLFGPEATGDLSYVLSVTTEQLRERMLPHSPGGRRVRRLRLPHRWCDWVWSPGGLPK